MKRSKASSGSSSSTTTAAAPKAASPAEVKPIAPCPTPPPSGAPYNWTTDEMEWMQDLLSVLRLAEAAVKLEEKRRLERSASLNREEVDKLYVLSHARKLLCSCGRRFEGAISAGLAQHAASRASSLLAGVGFSEHVETIESAIRCRPRRKAA